MGKNKKKSHVFVGSASEAMYYLETEILKDTAGKDLIL